MELEGSPGRQEPPHNLKMAPCATPSTRMRVDVLVEPHLYNLSGSFPQYHQSPDCLMVLNNPLSLVPAPGLSQPEGLPRRPKLCEPGLEWRAPSRRGDGEREDPPPLSFSPGLRP